MDTKNWAVEHYDFHHALNDPSHPLLLTGPPALGSPPTTGQTSSCQLTGHQLLKVAFPKSGICSRLTPFLTKRRELFVRFMPLSVGQSTIWIPDATSQLLRRATLISKHHLRGSLLLNATASDCLLKGCWLPKAKYQMKMNCTLCYPVWTVNVARFPRWWPPRSGPSNTTALSTKQS